MLAEGETAPVRESAARERETAPKCFFLSLGTRHILVLCACAFVQALKPQEESLQMKKPEKPDPKGVKKPPAPPKPVQPVVFMFQPQYKVVPPERLAQWEEAMRTRVGLPAEVVRALVAAGGVETDTPDD